jgi:hypothetical protein
MADVIEDGDIYFFYRLRVDHQRPRSLDDVQRLLMVLRPWRDGRLRVLVVGRKRLPAITEHERFWAFVDAVVARPAELGEALGSRTYWTRTRGVRTQPPAWPAGDGAYLVARHGRHTHLAYALQQPGRVGEVLRDLNVEPMASYVVAVRNPAVPVPPALAGFATREPDLPPALRGRFGDLRFVPLDPAELLDYPGIQLLLIGAAHDVVAELGVDLSAERERAARASVFDELRVSAQDQPFEPLFAGDWRTDGDWR